MSPSGLNTQGVVTFHDMQHEFFPQFFTEKERRMRSERYRTSAFAAQTVIAISEHAKGCMVDRYGVEPDKIQVIYQGCDAEYRPIDDLEQLELARSRIGLAKQFIYYPAATWPHKNHQVLFAAIQIMVERYQFDGHLVLTGTEKTSHEALLSDIDSRRLGNVVRILGYLPYSDLPYLYNLAKLMVFPSLFEGFGIPVLEAMACGCPVVCSQATSLPEVAGAAALYFNPFDPEEIAEKMWSVWSDDSKQKQLHAAGIDQARQFSWQKTARQTLAVYAGERLST
jgi:glycosyltransferase involved in cell wall biosynthesis